MLNSWQLGEKGKLKVGRKEDMERGKKGTEGPREGGFHHWLHKVYFQRYAPVAFFFQLYPNPYTNSQNSDKAGEQAFDTTNLWGTSYTQAIILFPWLPKAHGHLIMKNAFISEYSQINSSNTVQQSRDMLLTVNPFGKIKIEGYCIHLIIAVTKYLIETA